MEVAKLKNGTEEAKSLVHIVSASLRRILEKNPISVYELVMKCRDRNHQCFGNTADILNNMHYFRVITQSTVPFEILFYPPLKVKGYI